MMQWVMVTMMVTMMVTTAVTLAVMVTVYPWTSLAEGMFMWSSCDAREDIFRAGLASVNEIRYVRLWLVLT